MKTEEAHPGILQVRELARQQVEQQLEAARIQLRQMELNADGLRFQIAAAEKFLEELASG